MSAIGISVKLYCRACGIELTRELTELTDRTRLCLKPEADFIPQGSFLYREPDATTEDATAEDATTEDATTDGDSAAGGAGARWIVINLQDLRQARPHADPERLTGCCKLDGSAGINTCCANGHEIGVQSSDCWMAHEFAFDESRVRGRRVLRYAVSAYKLDLGERWVDFLGELRLCDRSELLAHIQSGQFELDGIVWNDAERIVTSRELRSGSIVHFQDMELRFQHWVDADD